MIIDCHGHYTTAPKALQVYRDAQIAALKNPSQAQTKGIVAITDEEIRESLEHAQLKLQRERGTDVTIFSPRASATRRRACTGRSTATISLPGCARSIRRTSWESASCRSRRACRRRAASAS